MDINKYISSGIPEAFALGYLTPAEKAEVEKVLSLYPPASAELAQIEEGMEAIAFYSAVAPPENLKKKVLSRVLGQEYAGSSVHREEKRKVVPLQRPVDEKKKKRPAIYNYYLAATISLTVIFSFATFYFFSKWQDAENRLYVVAAERTALAQQFKTAENKPGHVNGESAIHAGHFNEIKLQGLAPAPKASATVFWNKGTREVFLNPAGLPTTPTGKQYQLWAIVDGRPVDLGILTANGPGGLLKMKETENAAAFAITLEPAGGSPSPTPDQMYVMGAAAS